MKIVFYTTSFFPYISGVATAILNLSLGLTSRGHKIALCIPRAKSPVIDKLRKKGIKIIFLPSIKTKIYKDNDMKLGTPSTKSFLQVKKFNPDVVHFHTPALIGVESILTAKLLKKPLVGTFHTYFMSAEYQKILGLGNKTADFIEKILWKYNNSIYNRCDLVIAPCQFSQKDLKTHKLKKPVKVIHNAVNVQSLPLISTEKMIKVKKKYGLKKNVICYVGRISREKSLDLLMLAFNIVIRKIPSVQLLMIGGGPGLGELKALREALGLEKEIIFTGKIANQRLLRSGIFKAVNLFATPSTSEVQPMSVLEAMAFGLPVVGVKGRGMIELIKSNGILCPPGDIKALSRAMIQILRNSSLREKMGSFSEKMISQHHDLAKVSLEMEKAYQKLI